MKRKNYHGGPIARHFTSTHSSKLPILLIRLLKSSVNSNDSTCTTSSSSLRASRNVPRNSNVGNVSVNSLKMAVKPSGFSDSSPHSPSGSGGTVNGKFNFLQTPANHESFFDFF